MDILAAMAATSLEFDIGFRLFHLLLIKRKFFLASKTILMEHLTAVLPGLSHRSPSCQGVQKNENVVYGLSDSNVQLVGRSQYVVVQNIQVQSMCMVP